MYKIHSIRRISLVTLSLVSLLALSACTSVGAPGEWPTPNEQGNISGGVVPLGPTGGIF